MTRIYSYKKFVESSFFSNRWANLSILCIYIYIHKSTSRLSRRWPSDDPATSKQRVVRLSSIMLHRKRIIASFARTNANGTQLRGDAAKTARSCNVTWNNLLVRVRGNSREFMNSWKTGLRITAQKVIKLCRYSSPFLPYLPAANLTVHKYFKPWINCVILFLYIYI